MTTAVLLDLDGSIKIGSYNHMVCAQFIPHEESRYSSVARKLLRVVHASCVTEALQLLVATLTNDTALAEETKQQFSRHYYPPGYIPSDPVDRMLYSPFVYASITLRCNGTMEIMAYIERGAASVEETPGFYLQMGSGVTAQEAMHRALQNSPLAARLQIKECS